MKRKKKKKMRAGLLVLLAVLLVLCARARTGAPTASDPPNVCADGTRCVGSGVCCCQRVAGKDYCNPYCLPSDYQCCGCVLTYATNSTTDVVGYFCGGCPERSFCRAALPECFTGNRTLCASAIPGKPFVCSPAAALAASAFLLDLALF